MSHRRFLLAFALHLAGSACTGVAASACIIPLCIRYVNRYAQAVITVTSDQAGKGRERARCEPDRTVIWRGSRSLVDARTRRRPAFSLAPVPGAFQAGCALLASHDLVRRRPVKTGPLRGSLR